MFLLLFLLAEFNTYLNNLFIELFFYPVLLLIGVPFIVFLLILVRLVLIAYLLYAIALCIYHLEVIFIPFL